MGGGGTGEIQGAGMCWAGEYSCFKQPQISNNIHPKHRLNVSSVIWRLCRWEERKLSRFSGEVRGIVKCSIK
jgi:hypothetical protein